MESLYRKIKIASFGSSGLVFQAENLETGQTVAIKEIALNFLNSEIQILQLLKNIDYTVQMIETYNTKEKTCIVLEYCEENIESYLTSYEKVAKTLCKKWIYELLKAVEALHKFNIIHCDIKPSNLLLHNSSIKLADFGSSVILNNSLTETSLGGTPMYTSPESLENSEFGEKSDIWSIGVVFYEMATGTPLFDVDSISHLKISQCSPLNFSQFDEDETDFLCKTLQYNLAKRVRIYELLQCTYIQKITVQIDIAHALLSLLDYYSNATDRRSRLVKLSIGLFLICNESDQLLGLSNTRKLCETMIKNTNQCELTESLHSECIRQLKLESEYLNTFSKKKADLLNLVQSFLQSFDVCKFYNSL